jgi:hypothetical protein
LAFRRSAAQAFAATLSSRADDGLTISPKVDRAGYDLPDIIEPNANDLFGSSPPV